MQIHFYDQWDKQSHGMVKKSENYPTGFDRVSSFFRRWGNHLLILFSLMGTLFFSYLIFGNPNGQAVGISEPPIYVKPEEILYTVRHGDTLWSIAALHYPEKSAEEAIQLIQEKNGFKGSMIHAGQTILLP